MVHNTIKASRIVEPYIVIMNSLKILFLSDLNLLYEFVCVCCRYSIKFIGFMQEEVIDVRVVVLIIKVLCSLSIGFQHLM